MRTNCLPDTTATTASCKRKDCSTSDRAKKSIPLIHRNQNGYNILHENTEVKDSLL